MNCFVNISYSCCFVKFLKSVFQIFCVPVLSSCSINYWEQGVEISDYNCGFICFYKFLLNVFWSVFSVLKFCDSLCTPLHVLLWKISNIFERIFRKKSIRAPWYPSSKFNNYWLMADLVTSIFADPWVILKQIPDTVLFQP